MGRRVQRLFDGYKVLDGKNKTLFWALGIAVFVVALITIVLVDRYVNMTSLLRVTALQVLAAAVIAVLASMFFLYSRAIQGVHPVSQAPSEKLRDLIYFDFGKAASVLS